MEKKSIMYEFNLSAPYPDQDGVTMQNTAYRIESWKGEARASDVQDATAYILRYELIKKVFEHNNLDVEEIIKNLNPSHNEIQTIFVVNDLGLTVNLGVKEKQV